MINARCSSRLGGERSRGQRVRRWFVLSAMRNGRSISADWEKHFTKFLGGEVS